MLCYSLSPSASVASIRRVGEFLGCAGGKDYFLSLCYPSLDFVSKEAIKMYSRPSTIFSSQLKKLATMSCLTAILGLLPQIGMSQNLVTDDTVEWYTLGGD